MNAEDLLPVLERIAVAWERQAAATEAIAASWAQEIDRATERVAIDRAAFERDDRWRTEAMAMDEERAARRAAEREEDKQFVRDKEARDRAGWLTSLTNR